MSIDYRGHVVPGIGLLEFDTFSFHLDQKVPYKTSLKKIDNRRISKYYYKLEASKGVRLKGSATPD